MALTAKVEKHMMNKRSREIVVDCDVRACINCIWYEQHYWENRGNIRTFIPISSGTCLKHDVRRGALRHPCKDYETDEGVLTRDTPPIKNQEDTK